MGSDFKWLISGLARCGQQGAVYHLFSCELDMRGPM